MRTTVRLFLLIIITVTLLTSEIYSRKCITGSRGFLNGELFESWEAEECRSHEKYCISSWKPDFSSATASCYQEQGSEMTELCEKNTSKAIHLRFTLIECCNSDLCNTIQGRIPKPTDA